MCVANKIKQLAYLKVKNRQLCFINQNYKQTVFIRILKVILVVDRLKRRVEMEYALKVVGGLWDRLGMRGVFRGGIRGGRERERLRERARKVKGLVI